MRSELGSPTTHGEAPMRAIADVLAETRRKIVRLGQWMLPTFVLPLSIGEMVVTHARGLPVSAWLMLEMGSNLLTAVMLFIEHDARRRDRWFVAGLGMIVLTAIANGGPGMATGIALIAWLMTAVFFLESVRLPSTIAVLVLGGMCLAGYLRLPWLPWAVTTDRPAASWLLSFFSSSGSAWALAYLFDATLKRLQQAVGDEATARAMALVAQREREAALAAAAQAQRLESLGRLAGGMAHDFNNAIGIMSLCLDQLDGASDADREMLLDEMRRASRGAAATTRQLLSFARQGSTPGGRAPCGRVVLDLSSAIRRLFPESIAIEVDASSRLAVPLAVGDLEQMLLNLCLNARDAMANGGVLSLSAVDAEGPDGAPEVRIRVRDTGHGMTEEVLQRATDPFFTTKPIGKGTGLGLATVTATVQSVGGRLAVSSQVGVGTSIDLVLPGVELVTAERNVLNGMPQLLPSRQRVLVLEDDPQLQRLLERSLRQLNLDVTMTGTVHEALTTMEASELPDLLFTDAVLPDGGPTQLIARYRDRCPDGPVIVCSGYVPTPDLIAGIEAASYAFLGKPFGQQALGDAVHRALSQIPAHAHRL